MKIVATVSGIDEIELAKKADVIELRLDLGNFAKEKLPTAEYIVTFRRKVDGGKYEGDDERRIKILKDYEDVATYVDLECDLSDSTFEIFNCKIIESYHNFKETPSYEFLKELVSNRRGDYFKIATLGKTKSDVRKIVRLLLEFDDVIAFLMGKEFTFTRVLAVMLGSPFIYCYVGESKAPGQIEVGEARKVFEILGLTG